MLGYRVSHVRTQIVKTTGTARPLNLIASVFQVNLMLPDVSRGKDVFSGFTRQ